MAKINLDLMHDFQMKMMMEMQEKIYNKLNSKVIGFINSINYDIKSEVKRLEMTNLNNYKNIEESITNICKLSIEDCDISKPILDKRIEERFNSLKNEMKGYKEYYGYENDTWEVKETRRKMDVCQTAYREYHEKLKEFDEIIDKCVCEQDTFELTTFNVRDFDYKEVYSNIKGGVLNEGSVS